MTSEREPFGPDEVADVAAALEGWHAQGTSMSRRIDGSSLGGSGLAGSLRATAAEHGRELDVREGVDSVTIVLGEDQPLAPADLELINHLDAVIAGIAPIPGGQDPG